MESVGSSPSMTGLGLLVNVYDDDDDEGDNGDGDCDDDDDADDDGDYGDDGDDDDDDDCCLVLQFYILNALLLY